MTEIKLNQEADDTYLPEGTLVQIDFQALKCRKDFSSRTKAYRNFVRTNKDKIFHVRHNNAIAKSHIVSLLEDENRPRWLFFDSDLLVFRHDEDGAGGR